MNQVCINKEKAHMQGGTLRNQHGIEIDGRGKGKIKIHNIETHKSKATGEGESAQRNVVKMRSRKEIDPSKQTAIFVRGIVVCLSHKDRKTCMVRVSKWKACTHPCPKRLMAAEFWPKPKEGVCVRAGEIAKSLAGMSQLTYLDVGQDPGLLCGEKFSPFR